MLDCYIVTVLDCYSVRLLQCYSVRVSQCAPVVRLYSPGRLQIRVTTHHLQSALVCPHTHTCAQTWSSHSDHTDTPHHYFLVTQETIVKMYIKDLQEDDFEIALKVKMGITFLVKELTGVNKLSFVVSRFRLLFLKWSWQLTFHESVSIYQHIPTSNFYLMTRQSVLPSLQDWSYNYTDKMHKVFLHGCARADQ